MTTTAKASSNYYRQIRLGPAIGDWTEYRPDLDQSPLRTAQQLPVAFDSLSASQLKLALKLHYHLADKLTAQLSHGLDIKVELHSVDVLQVPYNAFVANLTDRLIQSRWQVGRWGWFHMLMDWSFASVVIDRLVGGTGETLPSDSHTEFSELELDILDSQMSEFVAPYTDTWKPLIDTQDISLSFAHGSLKKDNRYSGRAATIVFGFDFDFGENGHHRISIAYPNVTLKNLLSAFEKTHQGVEQRVFFNEETLSSIQVPIKSVLGKTKLTMAEVSALQPGDVIPLNIPLGSPVEITVDNVMTMRGVPGIHHSQLAIQITDNPELHQKLRSIVMKERVEPAVPQTEYLVATGSHSELNRPGTTQLSFLDSMPVAAAAVAATAMVAPIIMQESVIESDEDAFQEEAVAMDDESLASNNAAPAPTGITFGTDSVSDELEDHDDDDFHELEHESEDETLDEHDDELVMDEEDHDDDGHSELATDEDDDEFSWDDLDDDDNEK